LKLKGMGLSFHYYKSRINVDLFFKIFFTLLESY
jgi:hypothetical protein